MDQDIFTPVAFGRLSEAIVAQIKQALRRGRLQPGDRLPSERELSERLGTSRVTVRDALRLLQADGLVEIRRGARGGAFVTIPSADLVSERVANMLMLAAVTPDETAEARGVLEPRLMPLVCDRATEEDLADLLVLCDRAHDALEAGWYPAELLTRFHLRVARCTRNAVTELIVRCLHDPLSLEGCRQATGTIEDGLHQHQELVTAIAERDPARASAIMARHLATARARPAPYRGAGQRAASVP